jgi:peptidoglycan/LPS O-acetylase OafA/YrhL
MGDAKSTRSAGQLYLLGSPLYSCNCLTQAAIWSGPLEANPLVGDQRCPESTGPEKFMATLLKPLSADRLRDNNFDALRLVFASMVVLYHIGILSQAATLAWSLRVSAAFAVQAFFVVSGFLVTMSFENSSSIKSYVSKRLRRIAPAYIAVIIGAALGLSAISTLPLGEYFANRELWRYIAFNLLLSNFSAPDLPGVFQSNFMSSVNGSLWTIKIEVAFYCVVPFVVWATRRAGAFKVLAAIIVASLIWRLGFSAAAIATGKNIYGQLAKQLPGQMCFFAGGAWAYYRTRRGKSISALVAAAGVIVYAISGGWFYDFSAPLAVTAIVYWAALAGPRLPSAAKHGDFSYGVYLYHFPLIQTFIALGLFQWSPLTGWMTTVTFVLFCAVISWKFVERPSLHRSPVHA